MIGAEFLRHHARVLRFVEIVFREADGKSLHRAGTGPRHQGDDRRRIGAAAQKRAQRHIGDQTNARRFEQPMLQFFQALFFASSGTGVRVVFRQIPILANAESRHFRIPAGGPRGSF